MAARVFGARVLGSGLLEEGWFLYKHRQIATSTLACGSGLRLLACKRARGSVGRGLSDYKAGGKRMCVCVCS